MTDYIAEPLRHLAISLASLNFDPANARKHDQRNLDAIKSSLAKFGQRTPVVVQREGMVVRAGNGRLAAAKALGWDQIAAIVLDDDNATASQFAIADNRTAELAEWDNETLALLLDGWDKETREAVGFTDADLQEVMQELEPEQIEEDEVPEVPVDPITKPGDLWLLGNHRLLCGDSTKADDVARLMGGGKIDLVLTDPPYGVFYVGKTKDALKVENDDLSEVELSDLIKHAFDNAQANCRPGAYWYATVPACPLHLLFALDWKRRGILRQIMVWAKDSMVLGHSEYHYQHEPILFGWVPGERHKNSDRTRTTVWSYARRKASREHPTMKPLPLWEQAVRDGSRKGELVYDPFLGSGTTLIVAEQTDRLCYGMEISPQYCDMIVKRWENLTGKKAVLSNG